MHPHRFPFALLSAAAFFFALSVIAPPAQAGQETRDKILRLIVWDGAATVAEAVIDRQRPVIRQSFLAGHPGIANKVADAYVEAFAAELSARQDQFLALIVDVYAKTFTVAEIDALLAFHASPLGQKYRAATPAILQGSRQAGVVWGRKHGPAVAAAARARLKAMGYEVK